MNVEWLILTQQQSLFMHYRLAVCLGTDQFLPDSPVNITRNLKPKYGQSAPANLSVPTLSHSIIKLLAETILCFDRSMT